MSSPPKQYRLLSEWPHVLLWTLVIAAAMLIVGLGVLAPVLAWTALASLGIVLAGAFVLYGFSFLLLPRLDRGKDPGAWAVVRACRLGVALVPLFWLVLLVVSIPWSAPALLGLACSLPLGLMLLQWVCQPTLDKAIESEGLSTRQAQCLLWLGANVKVGMESACANQSVDLINFFLACGANVNAKHSSTDSVTLLAKFASSGKDQTVAVLRAHGADPHAKDPLCGSTPLEEAINADRAEVLRMILLGDPSQLERKDRNGDTLVLHAARVNAFSCIQALFYLDADLGASDRSGKTAFDIALGLGFKQMADWLHYASPQLTMEPSKFFAKKYPILKPRGFRRESGETTFQIETEKILPCDPAYIHEGLAADQIAKVDEMFRSMGYKRKVTGRPHTTSPPPSPTGSAH